MKNCVSFDDVLIQPRYSDIFSRKEISISSQLSKSVKLNIPIISAPMDTVTEVDMAVSMHNQGGLGIIYRYNSIEEQVALVRECANSYAVVGAAIGVSGDYLERAGELIENGAEVLCVDIAHGHHALMQHALKTLRNTYGWNVTIIAGNVATLEAFNDLSDWGADAIRVGIGGGSICSTRVQTGHGMPTLQSVIECSRSDRPAKLIADGGIKNSGDIVKAIGAGADFVMLGSLLSGTPEAPGEVVVDNQGSKRKVYRGMASKDAQINWRGHTASIEGVSSTVPLKPNVDLVLEELVTNIRSGLSYSGSKNIREFQAKCTFIGQTSAGAIESSTHIMYK